MRTRVAISAVVALAAAKRRTTSVGVCWTRNEVPRSKGEQACRRSHVPDALAPWAALRASAKQETAASAVGAAVDTAEAWAELAEEAERLDLSPEEQEPPDWSGEGELATAFAVTREVVAALAAGRGAAATTSARPLPLRYCCYGPTLATRPSASPTGPGPRCPAAMAAFLQRGGWQEGYDFHQGEDAESRIEIYRSVLDAPVR